MRPNPKLGREAYLYSVIIPTYNRAPWIGEALDSVLSQDVSALQVIVVDDGSTDATQRIVMEYGQPVQYVRQANQGPAAARNTGLALARGTFVSFLDSDDLFLPGKMKAELDHFEQFPEADAIISDSEAWLEHTRVSQSMFQDRGAPPLSEPTLISALPAFWLKQKYFATCCLTLRRTALERIGPFNIAFHRSEDVEFSLRLHWLCNVLLLPECLACVRRFDDNTRIGRPVPGKDDSAREQCDRTLWHYRALNRVQHLPSWHSPSSPAEVNDQLIETRREAAVVIGRHARGWQCTQCLCVIWSELQHGALDNAWQVLVQCLRPVKYR